MVNVVTKKNSANIYHLLRIAKGYQVKELADELRITPAYVNAIENGTRFPSTRLIKDYSQLFEVDEELILNFSRESDASIPFENILFRLLKMICK